MLFSEYFGNSLGISGEVSGLTATLWTSVRHNSLESPLSRERFRACMPCTTKWHPSCALLRSSARLEGQSRMTSLCDCQRSAVLAHGHGRSRPADPHPSRGELWRARQNASHRVVFIPTRYDESLCETVCLLDWNKARSVCPDYQQTFGI